MCLDFDSYVLLTLLEIETDRYHVFENDTDIFKIFFTDIWPVADILLTPIPIFQYLLTDIFADILTKYFGYSWWELLTRV